jgi:hypothetical protein
VRRAKPRNATRRGARAVPAHAIRGEGRVAAHRVNSSKIFDEIHAAQGIGCLTDSQVYPLFSFRLSDVKDAA